MLSGKFTFVSEDQHKYRNGYMKLKLNDHSFKKRGEGEAHDIK
jgi:hypothetical protein